MSETMELGLEDMVEGLMSIVNMADEDFEANRDTILQSLEVITNEDAKENLIERQMEAFEENGSSKSEIVTTGQKVLESYFAVFASLKNFTQNEAKKELFDMLYSAIEYVVYEACERYNPGTPLVRVQRLNEKAKLPTYAHPDDQGADVYAYEDVTIEPHSYGNMVHTGIALGIPKGWAVGVRARSGLSKKTTLRISNCYGTIDTSYKDEVCVLFDNIGDEPVTIHAGDRIAQLVLEHSYNAEFSEVDDVKQYGSNRNGGFGSSGN